MHAPVALVAVALGLVLAGCASPSADSPSSSPAPETSAAAASPTQATPSASSAEASPSAETTSEAAPAGPGSYITLAEYDADRSAYDSTDVVLFFNASWCSTCKVARDNIEADLAAIPSGLTIVVVDFDTANDLRQKYGVTVQHTFVQVDAAGTELAKWSGSVTADEIAKNTV